MSSFPFKKILIRSVKLVLRRPWLWVFGFFLGIFNIILSQLPAHWRDLDSLRRTAEELDLEALVRWLWQTADQFVWLVVILLLFAILLFFLYGLARVAVIESTGQILRREEVQDEQIMLRAWRSGYRQAWNLVALRLFAGAVLLLGALILISPIWYLYHQGISAGLAFLNLLAFFIFGVLTIFVMFGEVFGANFLVLGRHRILPAFVSGIDLFKNNWPVSILFAVLLMLVRLGLIILMGILIVGGTGLAQSVAGAGLSLPETVMVGLWNLVVSMIGWSIVAAFSQVAWTYAWFKLVKMEKGENTEKALVTVTEKSIVSTPKTELE